MSERLSSQPPLQEFAQFVDNLPGKIDTGEIYKLSEERDLALSRFCNPHGVDESQPKPFPTGHIIPLQIGSVDRFIRESGNKYFKYDKAGSIPSAYDSGDYRLESRAWEVCYVGHIMARNKFHLAFLENLEGANNDLRTICEEAAQTEVLPNVFRFSRPKIDKEKAFNYTEWITYSVLNVLFEDPDKLSTSHQQQALRIFNQEIAGDETGKLDEVSLFSVGSNDKAEKVGKRLPPRFQLTHEERSALVHEKWRTNKHIKQIFGRWGSGKSFSSACNEMLINHPGDIIQVLLLNITDGSCHEALRALHVLGGEPQQILDAVINEESSFRAVHKTPNTVYEITEKELGVRGLFGLCEQSDDPHTLRALLAASKESLGAAGAEQEQLEQVIASRDKTIEELKSKIGLLEHENKAGELFSKHGLDKNAPYSTAEVVVKSLRRKYRTAYHPKSGKNPDAATYSQLNAELNAIMRFKKIRHNDAEWQDDPSPAKPRKVHPNKIMWDNFLGAALGDVLNAKGNCVVGWSSLEIPVAADVAYRYVYGVDTAKRLVALNHLLEIFAAPEGEDNRTDNEKMAYGYLVEFKVIETNKSNKPN